MAGINFDFTTGSLPAGITFTRASIGTYNSSGNILTTASSNVARFNYIAGVANLLIEPSATNLLVQSNNFSTTWLAANGAVITAAQFVSPDGTNTGWSITSGTGSGQAYQLGTVANVPHTISIWAKAITGGGSLIQLYTNGLFTNLPITTTLARVFTTLTPAAGSGVISTLIALPNTAGVTDGIFGVQLETGSVMTSYIPTTTASVTRAADSAAFTIPAGVNQLTYTFDDNSTQTVAVSPGSYTIPTTLNRPNIKSVVGRYAFDFTSGSLPAGMTFTRPSIGTYTNAGGTLITAGNDVARFNYVAGVSNLLIEGSATNLCLQSNNLNASWGAYNSGGWAGAQFISVDGTNNGWKLFNQAVAQGTVAQNFTYSNIPYTLSIWAKQITGTSPLQLQLPFNTSPGTALTATLVRSSLTGTPPAGADLFQVQIKDTTITNAIGVYGAQLETGSVATSYIPTTTAAVTRAADSATFTIPAGVNALLYTFDDGSTQQVSVTAGSYTIPVNLSRPNIKSIQGLSGFDFTTGTLPPGITFTRTSIGTYFDSGNILRTASNNVARMNYVSGVSCLLIEGSATNLLLQSNNFSTTWTPGLSAVATSAQFVSPDGTNNGWSLTNGGAYGYVQQALTWVGIQTMSVWGKTIVSNAPINLSLNGDLNSIAVSATLTRISATNSAGSASGSFQIQVRLDTAATDGIFGAQMESGSKMTSYIPTTTAAVTRAADSATFTIPTGVTQLTYTFDDNSTQTVSATAGSYTIPTTLNRPNIKSIAWITTAPITPTPSPARLGAFQSFGLAANIPLQLTAGGVYRLYILNTGPGNLFVSTGNTPGVNAQSMVIPPLKAAPLTTTAGAIWLSSDQDSTVSIAAMPR